MAWIESHQSLRDHPKLYALCDHLGIGKIEAIGRLHMLWWWALDYAANGDVTLFTASQIARAMEWTGDSEQLLSTLKKVKFLDEKDGVTTLHDWEQYTLHYNLVQERKERKLRQIRQRVKRFRKRSGNAHETQCNAATKPNQPNLTKPTKPNLAVRKRAKVSLEDLTITPELSEWAQREGIPNPGAYLEEFKDYWRGTTKTKTDWVATYRNRLRFLRDQGKLKQGSVWDSA